MKQLIKNGDIVTAEKTFRGDLLIVDGVIAEIGRGLPGGPAITEIDASGRYVLPGGVDVHTHLNLALGERRVSDGFYLGMRAAAFGGTTTIVDHPETGPADCSLFHQPDYYRELLAHEAVIDYGIHGVFQRVDSEVLRDIPGLIRSGISSAKVYLTYDGMLNDAEIAQVLQAMGDAQGLTAFHAEDDAVIRALREQFGREGKRSALYHALSRPDTTEADAIARILELAWAGGNIPVYIVHLSTAKGLAVIEKAKARGQRVFAETCPQYLLLNQSCYQQAEPEGLKYVMAPPLRSSADQQALWRGLSNGSIDVLATDHCSFSFADKVKYGQEDFRQCPGGCPGVETRLPLCYSAGVGQGRFSINRFVDLVATTPAKLMGLYPRKGALQPGADADIVVWNPDLEKTLAVTTLHQQCDYTPFAGMQVKGWPELTMLRGRVIVKDGDFFGEKGFGEFLERTPFAGSC